MPFFLEEYFPVLILFTIIALLACVILGASYFLGVQKPDPEKVSIYECGFEPYEDARNKFNVRFYVIAILFIVFDLEAVLLFPWAVSLAQAHSFGLWTVFDFLLELVVGFFYVWRIGALDWK